MTSPGSVGIAIPLDVLAILTDLQQQIANPTGIVATHQHTMNELHVIVQSPFQPYSKSYAPALRQPPSGADPSAVAAASALPSVRDVPVGA